MTEEVLFTCGPFGVKDFLNGQEVSVKFDSLKDFQQELQNFCIMYVEPLLNLKEEQFNNVTDYLFNQEQIYNFSLNSNNYTLNLFINTNNHVALTIENCIDLHRTTFARTEFTAKDLEDHFASNVSSMLENSNNHIFNEETNRKFEELALSVNSKKLERFSKIFNR